MARRPLLLDPEHTPSDEKGEGEMTEARDECLEERKATLLEVFSEGWGQMLDHPHEY